MRSLLSTVFDCEELLEQSIRSVRSVAQHVCVVYQTVSNFGNEYVYDAAAAAAAAAACLHQQHQHRCNPGLVRMLLALQSDGLIDSLLEYIPKTFTAAEKRAQVSRFASYVPVPVR